MEVFNNIADLRKRLQSFRLAADNHTVGFVPTMGALHEGHLHLVAKALKNSDLVICSIFVNPTQFNNKSDLEKYPRKTVEDLSKLEDAGCDLVFVPSEEEIYPAGTEEYQIDLGLLDEVMEGKYRPGHFKGVAMVVERFFNIIQPDQAYFGKKDFQQVAVIQKMVEQRDLKVQIVPVEIVRSENGLALSSRNERLTEQQKEDALIIYQTLKLGEKIANENPNMNPGELQQLLVKHFNQEGRLKLEYLEIVNNSTLLPAEELKNSSCCIAAYCGEVRLIDNMQMR